MNEIVAHRRLAIDLVSELGLEDPDTLKQHILSYGATNTNVFVAAYSSTPAPGDGAVRFQKFLSETAPYDSESSLSRFLLEHYGISTATMDYHSEHNSMFTAVFSSLLTGYEELQFSSPRAKEKLLIEHEAQQLTRLVTDRNLGFRSIFVTADLRLQRVLQRSAGLHDLLGNFFSAVGLVGLVDVMIGIGADNRSIARLIWAMPRNDDQQMIRDHLVNKALKQYDAAMTMAMHHVIEQLTSEGIAEAQKHSLDLLNVRTAEETVKVIGFLDRLEDRFYAKMREVIERQEGKST